MPKQDVLWALVLLLPLLITLPRMDSFTPTPWWRGGARRDPAVRHQVVSVLLPPRATEQLNHVQVMRRRHFVDARRTEGATASSPDRVRRP